MFWSEIIAKNVRYGLRKLAKMKAKWKNTKLKNLQGWQGRLLRTNSTSRLVHEALACPAYPWFITTDYSCPKIMDTWPLLTAAVDWTSGWRRTRLPWQHLLYVDQCQVGDHEDGDRDWRSYGKRQQKTCLVKVDFFAINGGVQPLDYFIQMFKKNHLQVLIKLVYFRHTTSYKLLPS